MASGLESFVGKMVWVLSGDGRCFVGTMNGFDQMSNVILQDTAERIYNVEEGVQQVQVGLYVIRGQNIAVVGELDEELDQRLDLKKICAESLAPIWEQE